jgi:hypothetical protein
MAKMSMKKMMPMCCLCVVIVLVVGVAVMFGKGYMEGMAGTGSQQGGFFQLGGIPRPPPPPSVTSNPVNPVSKPIGLQSNQIVYVNETQDKELKKIVTELNKMSKHVHPTAQGKHTIKFDVNKLHLSLLPNSGIQLE